MNEQDDLNYDESVLIEFKLDDKKPKIFARVSWVKKDELLVVFTCNPFIECKHEWVHEYILRYTDKIEQSDRSTFMRESIRSNLKIAVKKALKSRIIS